jgi:hypothetical protein
MRAKAEAFPLTVKAGSTAVKIYGERKSSGDYYRVVYHLGGKRRRLNFSRLDRAKAEAQAKAAQLARGDVDAFSLISSGIQLPGAYLISNHRTAGKWSLTSRTAVVLQENYQSAKRTHRRTPATRNSPPTRTISTSL